MDMRKIIDGWVRLYLAIIIVLIALNIPFTTTESSTEKELYTVQEPHNATVKYYEKETYIDKVPLKINNTVNWYITNHRFNDEFDLIATLKNTDNSSGEFWITFHVETSKGSSDFTTNKINLSSGESYQIEKRFIGIFSYVTYKVRQPTIEVEKIREVPIERITTRYRDLVKSREVVRVNKIKLSILQRILKIPAPPEPPSQPPEQNVSNDE
jgi:hypothetical protein